jgi:hypothetical protein
VLVRLVVIARGVEVHSGLSLPQVLNTHTAILLHPSLEELACTTPHPLDYVRMVHTRTTIAEEYKRIHWNPVNDMAQSDTTTTAIGYPAGGLRTKRRSRRLSGGITSGGEGSSRWT